MTLSRTGYGMKGCQSITNPERVRQYGIRLGKVIDPHAHATRATAGVLVLAKLRKEWKRVDRAKGRIPAKASKPKKSTVVPFVKTAKRAGKK